MLKTYSLADIADNTYRTLQGIFNEIEAVLAELNNVTGTSRIRYELEVASNSVEEAMNRAQDDLDES